MKHRCGKIYVGSLWRLISIIYIVIFAQYVQGQQINVEGEMVQVDFNEEMVKVKKYVLQVLLFMQFRH